MTTKAKRVRAPTKKPEVPTKKLTWRQVEKIVLARTQDLESTVDNLTRNYRSLLEERDNLGATVANFQNLMQFHDEEHAETKAALETERAETLRMKNLAIDAVQQLKDAKTAAHDADLKRLDAEEASLRYRNWASVKQFEYEETRIAGMIAGFVAIIASAVAVVQACL